MDEKKPIVRVFFAKLKEAFANLSDEEKMKFMRKDRKNLDELGCKFETIDCRWSNEEWHFIGIEEWPTLEALEKRAKFEKDMIKTYRKIKDAGKNVAEALDAGLITVVEATRLRQTLKYLEKHASIGTGKIKTAVGEAGRKVDEAGRKIGTGVADTGKKIGTAVEKTGKKIGKTKEKKAKKGKKKNKENDE